MKQQIILLLLILITLNLHGQIVGIAVFDEDHNAGVNIFKANDKFGIKDWDKNEVLIPAEYDNIKQEVKDNFIINLGYSQFGLYNSKLKKIVIPIEFNEVSINNLRGKYNFQCNDSFVIVVRKKDKLGLLDHNYNYIFDVDYDKIEPHASYVRIVKVGKDGIYFFDKTSTAIPLEYDQVIEKYPTNYFIAIKDKKYFLFDNKGKLISGNDNKIELFRHLWNDRVFYDILISNANSKNGIYNTSKARFFLPVKYDKICDVFEDNYIVEKNSKYGIVNTNNMVIIPFDYDTLGYLKPLKSNPLLLACKKGKFGLINFQNKNITKFEYSSIENINDFYKVKKKDKYSVIDSLGKAITITTFDEIGSFYNGKCAVFLNHKIGYMDITGKITDPIERPSKARGYRDIHDLFRSFVKILKSKNDSLLMEFCKDVVFDEYTKEFMFRINYEYRGFPGKMQKSNYTIDDAIKNYYQEIKMFYDRLKTTGQLENLEYKGLDRDVIGFWEESYSLLGTEARGVLVTQKREYHYKLGELIYMDGFWKSFTLPRD